MHIHRTECAGQFTVIPNTALQDRGLSYTARGLLADLLSRPDGWREDARHMADSSPQGRGAVAKAMRELRAHGYYRIVKVRDPEGRIVTEAYLYDTPQVPTLEPGDRSSGPGEPAPGLPGVQPPKKLRKKQNPPSREPSEPRGARLTPRDPATREAVAALFRVIRPEPRLRIGAAEAAALAPLVGRWLEHVDERQLAQALLLGLPERIHSPAGLLRNRLLRKMPPVPVRILGPQRGRPPRAADREECPVCRDPVREPGICRACAGLGTRQVRVGAGAGATARGAAKARAVLAWAREASGGGRPEAVVGGRLS